VIQVGSMNAAEGKREHTRHFGEAGLIASSRSPDALPKRTASVVAAEPSLLLVLPCTHYATFLRLLPGIDQQFAKAKVRLPPAAARSRAPRVWQPCRAHPPSPPRRPRSDPRGAHDRLRKRR
jgi:hypothetical protein